MVALLEGRIVFDGPVERVPLVGGGRGDRVRPSLLILRKDLLVLRRSPALLGVLIAYPLVIALLIGLTAAYANAKPRVAFVDRDGIPPRVTVAGNTFDVDGLIDEVAKNVEIVRMSESEAKSQLEAGRVAAVVTVPPGFVADLQGLVASPHLTLATGTGGITPRVRQQMQALVYNLNLHLQKAFIEADIKYVNLLLHGGTGHVLGRDFSIIGLDGTSRLLEQLPPSAPKAKIVDFVHDARLALALTDQAIRATATPIVLDEQSGQRPHVRAVGAGAGVRAGDHRSASSALLLAAGALAAERDENAIGRLVRGLVGLGQLVAAKIALAVAVALGIGLAILLGFGIAVEAGNVSGGEPWQRLPLVLVGVALAGAAVGAVGALVGRARARVAHGLAGRDPRRPAGRLPRARPARDRPRGGLDQRRVPVRARRALLRVGALRRRRRGRRSGREAAWLRRPRRRVRRAGPAVRAAARGRNLRS